MNFDKNKEYGLVLEGGGAKGSYQIGAWKALRELGINIKGVVGTSVGALNGAMIVQGEFDEALKLWREIEPSKVLNIDNDMRELIRFPMKIDEIKKLRVKMKKFIGIDGIDITPLKNLIRDTIDEEKIRNSKMDYGLVTVSLSDMKSIQIFKGEIEEGLLCDFLLASSYLPVFKREKLHGKIYIDGGFYDKTPVSMLIDKGYKDIIVVRLHGIGIDKRYTVPEEVNIITIDPKDDLGGILDFSNERALSNINIGYYDTIKVFNDLKGKYFYINTDKDEEFFIKKLLNLDYQTSQDLISDFGINDLPVKRNLFEIVFPRIAKKMNLKNGWDYKDLIIGIYEYYGKKIKIDRFKIYDLKELIEKVSKRIDEVENNHYKSLNRFIKNFDID